MAFDADEVHEYVESTFASLGSPVVDPYRETGFEVYSTEAGAHGGDVLIVQPPRRRYGRAHGLVQAAKTVGYKARAEAARETTCHLCSRPNRVLDSANRCTGRTMCERSRISQLSALERAHRESSGGE
jgi:hypothetical protein